MSFGLSGAISLAAGCKGRPVCDFSNVRLYKVTSLGLRGSKWSSAIGSDPSLPATPLYCHFIGYTLSLLGGCGGASLTALLTQLAFASNQKHRLFANAQIQHTSPHFIIQPAVNSNNSTQQLS